MEVLLIVGSGWRKKILNLGEKSIYCSEMERE